MAAVTLLMPFAVRNAAAFVPIGISIKVILDENDNWPSAGNLNTADEINAEVDWANTILAENNSEFRISRLELVELTGLDQWFDASATANNGANRDALRAAAMASPTTYLWRSNAINIYINGGMSSAISKFPPDNDIILMNQWCANTPSCILHELGHSLNLMHTHEPCCTNRDECADTITDEDYWSRDQIAMNSFGHNYANLSAADKDRVDLVFNNVMSYHCSEPQLRLSTCQDDRVSTQGDSDRSWLLASQPVYVDRSYTGSTQNGRFPTPYKTVGGAIGSGLTNDVLVLEQGIYDEPGSVMTDTNILLVPRSGAVTIGNGAHLYSLPVNLTSSQTAEVSQAAKEVAAEDKAARKILRESEQEAQKEPSSQARVEIEKKGKAIARQHHMNAITHLKQAQDYAQGQEKVAILLEIGQRYKAAGDCEAAADFFNRVAELTQQVHLRERALMEIKLCGRLSESPASDDETEMTDENQQ